MNSDNIISHLSRVQIPAYQISKASKNVQYYYLPANSS